MPPFDQYASQADMRDWARHIMHTRRPDEIIGQDYLRRWYLTPRSPFINVYLHQILRSDDDRALHDHPWDNSSLIIDGGYFEHMPDGVIALRGPGDYVARKAADLHRLELIEGQPVISLFVTGPKFREWGFDAPAGWTHNRHYPMATVAEVERAA